MRPVTSDPGSTLIQLAAMEDMQRALPGNTAVSEARIFDPDIVQVANYDQLAVVDFSNVQYLEITDSEAEEEEEEYDEDDGDEVEDRTYDHTPAGNAEGRTAPTTIPTPAQKRKKEKRKNKKAKAKADDSGMPTPLCIHINNFFTSTNALRRR